MAVGTRRPQAARLSSATSGTGRTAVPEKTPCHVAVWGSLAFSLLLAEAEALC